MGFPPSVGSPNARGMRDQREVGLLAHGIMSPGGSTPIRSVTVRPSLPPFSCTRSPFGSPGGALALAGRLRAYPVPPASLAGCDPASPPVARLSAAGRPGNPCPSHGPFGPSLSASLAWRQSRRVSAVHVRWSYHPPSLPHRLLLAVVT